MTAPLIEARGLSFAYPDGTHALAGVDLDLFAGETLVLLGANGSGKTTFLLHLNGLLHGTGELRVCGVPVARQSARDVRRKVGFLFQHPDDQLFMPTVLEDVAFAPLSYGRAAGEARDLALEWLARVDMLHAQSRSPQHLSMGEKRRVAIAGVLAGEPEILVLDEPTTYLDPPSQRAVVTLLRSLPQPKLTVTHDIPFARAIGTRAAFFSGGKILGEGPIESVIRQFDWSL